MPISEYLLREKVALGEDSSRQFKVNVNNAESLASEMAAFANANGGTIYIGVADSGDIPGFPRGELGRINQLVSNAASQLVRSPLSVQTENIRLGNGKLVMVLTVPKGLDKPYFDKNGVIWLKTGADKRRVNSKEELRRLFQASNQFHADELPTKADVERLDKLLFRDFLRQEYDLEYPASKKELVKLLQNLNLATDGGVLNLAAVLMFAEQPELIVPQFVVKAIRFPGTEIHASKYEDTENFSGPMPRMFKDVYAFIMRNLRKVQAGNGVNAPGTPEIPGSVFEELLVNALMHRDYLVSAAIRVFVYDDRIEIVSPGHLPNNLTVEKIKTGNSNIRNPILLSYAAKNLLPYHGLGSGIKRVLAAWPDVDFIDDHEGCQFTAIVYRKIGGLPESSPENGSKVHQKKGPSAKSSPESSPEIRPGLHQNEDTSLSATEQQVLNLIRADCKVTTDALAQKLGVSKRTIIKRIQKLKSSGLLQRKGPTKGGFWVLS